jgi:hypothetical protein
VRVFIVNIWAREAPSAGVVAVVGLSYKNS